MATETVTERNGWNEAAADLSRDEWGWIELIIGALGSFVFLTLVSYV